MSQFRFPTDPSDPLYRAVVKSEIKHMSKALNPQTPLLQKPSFLSQLNSIGTGFGGFGGFGGC